MAKLFELYIYGNDDEVVKTYATDKVRWGVFMQAVELQDQMQDMTESEQFYMITQFMKKIFPSLTDEDLEMADGEDVINTFNQLIKKANSIGGKSKNVRRAAAK